MFTVQEEDGRLVLKGATRKLALVVYGGWEFINPDREGLNRVLNLRPPDSHVDLKAKMHILCQFQHPLSPLEKADLFFFMETRHVFCHVVPNAGHFFLSGVHLYSAACGLENLVFQFSGAAAPENLKQFFEDGAALYFASHLLKYFI